MLRKVLFTVILMTGICTFSFSQTRTDSLDINVLLKEEYVIGDTVNFEYVNNSKKYLYVYVSLERADNKREWMPYFHEIYIDHKFSNFDNQIHIIHEGNFSLSKYSSEPIKKHRNDKWTVKSACLYGQETIALFRFKYTIGEIPYGLVDKETGKCPKETVYYSKPFYIKKSTSAKKNELGKYQYKFNLLKL